jgi:hypothetical protein
VVVDEVGVTVVVVVVVPPGTVVVVVVVPPGTVVVVVVVPPGTVVVGPARAAVARAIDDPAASITDRILFIACSPFVLYRLMLVSDCADAPGCRRLPRSRLRPTRPPWSAVLVDEVVVDVVGAVVAVAEARPV